MAEIYVNIFERSDSRLGRHVEHDERSHAFAHLPKEARPKGVSTFWGSKIAPLNQGQTGSCTGNAEAQWLNTDFAAPVRAKTHDSKPLTEADALAIYSLGTHLDNIPGIYPPDDTGCSGNAVCKAGIKLGYLQSFGWIFSLSSLQAVLEQTPVIVGTLWTNTMMTPHRGLVTVGPLDDSNIAGGHEYLCCGVDFKSGLFQFRNSWGNTDAWPGCKPGGYFAMTFSDFAGLLEAHGDVTVPHGIS